MVLVAYLSIYHENLYDIRITKQHKQKYINKNIEKSKKNRKFMSSY